MSWHLMVFKSRRDCFFWNLNPAVSIFSVCKVCEMVKDTPVGMSWHLRSIFPFVFPGISSWCSVSAWERTKTSDCFEGWNNASGQAINWSRADSSQKINIENLAFPVTTNTFHAVQSPSKYYSTLQHELCNVSRIKKQQKMLKKEEKWNKTKVSCVSSYKYSRIVFIWSSWLQKWNKYGVVLWESAYFN
jgi:hypothetical protein